MERYSKLLAADKLKEKRNSVVYLISMFAVEIMILILVLNYLININVYVTAAAIIATVILSLYCFLRLTSKVRNDMKSQETYTVEIVPTSICHNEPYYEAGSGMLYIPILARILPRFYNQKMKKKFCSYIIDDKGYKYPISPNESKSKKVFNLVFGKESKEYLGYY